MTWERCRLCNFETGLYVVFGRSVGNFEWLLNDLPYLEVWKLWAIKKLTFDSHYFKLDPKAYQQSSTAVPFYNSSPQPLQLGGLAGRGGPSHASGRPACTSEAQLAWVVGQCVCKLSCMCMCTSLLLAQVQLHVHACTLAHHSHGPVVNRSQPGCLLQLRVGDPCSTM